MRLSHFLTVLSLSLPSLPSLALSHPNPTFDESLTIRPSPDGRFSVLFEFTTHFSLSPGSTGSHHSLTPPSLLLPLANNGVSELTISFVSGKWDARTSAPGPMGYETGGGGGEVRAWLDNGDDADARWTRVTHALGGLFCAGIGSEEIGEAVRTMGGIYPPLRSSSSNLTHYFTPHPHVHLCTENLSPFLTLLPSKGISGLSSLLSPGVIFAWGFKSEGIEVIMPDEGGMGRWRGWWEGIVDVSPHRKTSLRELFRKGIPQAFPEARSSVVRLVKEGTVRQAAGPKPKTVKRQWVDGVVKEVVEWDIAGVAGSDIELVWDEDPNPRHIDPPMVSVTRTVADPRASDGTLLVRIANHADVPRDAVYTEVWPWWVKGWISEVSISDGAGRRDDLIRAVDYHPSSPPLASTTTIHFTLHIPAETTLTLRIPFSKLTLKYKEHRPDAERGREIPSSVLTLLDLIGEASEDGVQGDTTSGAESNPGRGHSMLSVGTQDPRRSGRWHVYANRVLLDVPTPDFSMPYNVIIMSSTVMAVFFGSIQGRLIRRWGWIQKEDEGGKEKEE